MNLLSILLLNLMLNILLNAILVKHNSLKILPILLELLFLMFTLSFMMPLSQLKILISMNMLNFLLLLHIKKRSKNHKTPNNSKLEKAHDFISLVEKEIKSNKLSSVDETINYLFNHKNSICEKMNLMITMSTLISMRSSR